MLTIANRNIGSASRGGRFQVRGGQRDRGHKRPYDYQNNQRGGRGGRGSQTRFQGRGRGRNESAQPDDGLKLDKNILEQMNSKQRAAFYKDRDAIRSSDETTSQARNASALQSGTHIDEISAVTEAQVNPKMNSASSQFGREGNRSLDNASHFNRKQGAIISGERFISSARVSKSQQSEYNFNIRARAEIDSRADTVCAGSTFRLIEESNHYCVVSGFHSDMTPMQNIPVATVATAFDDPVTQETYVLIFYEALYFGDTMEHSLISPMQLRHNGLKVDQTPRQYDIELSHGISFPNDDQHELFIPFHLHGCISYFSTRIPTDREMQSCRFIYMTEDSTWEPYSDHFGKAELPFAHKSTLPLQGNSRHVYGSSTANRRCNVEPSVLAKQLGISVYNAQLTLKSTTQLAVRHLSAPISSRVRTRQGQLRFPHLRCRVYSDTMFSEQKSLTGNTCAQVFLARSCGFSDLYCMPTKGEAGDRLNTFITTYGIPEELTTDNAKEETLGTWAQVRKKYLIHQTVTEPHTPQQNKTELEIGALKRHYRRLMHNQSIPESLWDFGLKHTARIRSFTARDSLNGRTPYELLTGQTPDISEIMEFSLYDWIKYYDSAAFPSKREFLGRWLGPAEHVGQALCYYILKDNGQVIARSSVRPLTPDELTNPDEIQDRENFTKQINPLLGDFDETLILDVPNDEPEEPLILDDDQQPEAATPAVSSDTPERVGLDPLIQASIILPRGDRSELGRVLDRKRNAEGLYVGRKHKMPALDSRVYVVEFQDGEKVDISYNTIAEHLYSQVDSEGNQYQNFKEIIGHRKGKNAIDIADQYTYHNGRKTKKKTTAGWDLEVEWKDGSSSWISLKEMKNSNPVEVAQYAIDNRIDHEAAFDWWARDILKKKQRLIKMSQSHRLRTGYKFGLRVPNTVEEALEIDRERGDTLWQDAINKEMANVRIAFDIKSDRSAPPGYLLIPHNIIFEIKMDFTRKARLVAGGHKTAPPTELTYSSVVSGESVRIGFLLAALNDVDIVAADVGNAYLNAFTKEKVYIITGPEFGPLEQGKAAVIVRALYGLKSSGAMWRAHFAGNLRDMGFTSCLGDPDVWFRSAEKKDKTEYYEYILVYVDDLLIISHQTDTILHVLENHFKYRLKDVGSPKRYLGATIEKIDVGGMRTWCMSAREYLEKAIHALVL
mmetsp:Transcript_2147/g.3294  ORF Transcript_2147/g.3294 Transcript_2147/m.3294 type:complete len:1178 (+) Transcript_2147:1032-4565(+)